MHIDYFDLKNGCKHYEPATLIKTASCGLSGGYTHSFKCIACWKKQQQENIAVEVLNENNPQMSI